VLKPQALSVSSTWVEVKPRRYTLNLKEKEAFKLASKLLGEAGVRVSRRAGWVVKLEDTAYGLVVAVMKNGYDRMRYWRLRRLGVNMM
jgi:hypothetical protein